MHPRYMSKVITVESEPTNDYVMCGGSGGLSGDVCERAFVSDSFVCVCVCICIYIYIYVYVYIYIYIYIYGTMHTCAFTCMCMCR